MSQTNSRNHSFDLLRGLAALGIVVFHVLGPYFSSLRSLYFFVDFFFVLSGYVLSSAVDVRTWESARQFTKHRAMRVFPMAVSALIFSEALRILPLLMHKSVDTGDVSNIWKEFLNFVVAVTLLQIFSHSSQLLLFPLWSLSAEWLVNLTAVLFRKVVGEKQLHIFIFLGSVFFATGLFTNLVSSPSDWAINIGRCMLGFGTGQLIYGIKKISWSKNTSRSLFISAVVSTLAYYLVLNKIGIKALILAPVIFGFVVWVFSIRELNVKKKKIIKLSQFSGRYSYGIYVWHIPALGVTDILLNRVPMSARKGYFLNIFELIGTLVISLLFTNIIHNYIEKRFFSLDGLNSLRLEKK